jgi:hypothetical protein
MRFTIRDLVLLTTVAALAIGWSIDHYQQARRYYKLEWQSCRDVENLKTQARMYLAMANRALKEARLAKGDSEEE